MSSVNPGRSDVVLTAEQADAVDLALKKAASHAVAFSSNDPYPDDPRWTPWTRFGKPMAERCQQARLILKRARDDPGSVPHSPWRP